MALVRVYTMLPAFHPWDSYWVGKALQLGTIFLGPGCTFKAAKEVVCFHIYVQALIDLWPLFAPAQQLLKACASFLPPAKESPGAHEAAQECLFSLFGLELLSFDIFFCASHLASPSSRVPAEPANLQKLM